MREPAGLVPARLDIKTGIKQIAFMNRSQSLHIPKNGWFVIPFAAVIQKETFFALEKQLVWRLCQVLKKVPTE